jgi:hypothetical protein
MYRKFIFILITALMLLDNLSAQTLSGKITDLRDQAIPNAAVYIKEINLGIVADDRGLFQTSIKNGAYTIEISSLGYERSTFTINVLPEGLNLHFRLKDKTYEIKEVTITPGKEDPAYRIMRHVIARAPYHLNQTKSYESNIYLKGKFKVEKVPALIKMQIKDKEFTDMIGKLFLFESQNEVKYQAPDRYEQKVIAVNSTIPKKLNIDVNNAMSVVTNNIYTPSAFGGLLSINSFSVYKFKLEETSNEEGHDIFKIRVIPKKKSGKLFDGWLFVVDRIWNIQQAQLNVKQAGTEISFNLTYQEIKKEAFLPASYDMKVNVNTMGIKGNGQFYASIQYNKLETNDDTGFTTSTNTVVPQLSISKPATITKKQQKKIDKLEELASKEELTTREAYKMAKLMQETVEPEEIKKHREGLEIKSSGSNITVTLDSMALLRDSSFWNQTRKLPLHTEELQSFIRRDSLKGEVKPDSIKKNKNKTNISSIIFGDKINLSKKTSIEYGGLLSALPEYNFTDGFWIGQKISLQYNFDDNRSVKLSPAVYYANARETVLLTNNLSLIYAPMRNGLFETSFGNTSSDFAGSEYGIHRFINSIASLLFAKNPAKFYNKKFIDIANRIDIANGFVLYTKVNYENRSSLDNKTSYSFFGNEPEANIPRGMIQVMPGHKSYSATLAFKYTPRYRYRILGGRKVYADSKYPTLYIGYKKAFPMGGVINSSYDKIEASVRQSINTDMFSRFNYLVNAGIFANKDRTYLPDFRHFNANEIIVSDKSLYNSFSLLDNYEMATNDKWLQTHLNYTSNYLLIKQLPFLQKYLFDEAIHLKTLCIPGKVHSEIGYSVGFGGIGRIGIFAGFDKLKYNNIGFSISLPLINFSGKP